jgi:hypothetical protein
VGGVGALDFVSARKARVVSLCCPSPCLFLLTHHPVEPATPSRSEVSLLSFSIVYVSIDVQNASCATERRILDFEVVFGSGPGQIDPEDFLDAVYQDLLAVGYPGPRSSLTLTVAREGAGGDQSQRSRRNTCRRCGAEVSGDTQVPTTAAGIASLSISSIGSSSVSNLDMFRRSLDSDCSTSVTFIKDNAVVDGEKELCVCVCVCE